MDEARQRTAWLIDHFLEGSLGGVDFQDFQAVARSKDTTVQYGLAVVGDLIDNGHTDGSSISRTEWGHLERTRLALLSGARIKTRRVYRNGLPEIVNLLCLLGYIVIWIAFGMGWHILLCHVVLLGLGWWCMERMDNCLPRVPFHDSLYPFTAISQLADARRRTPRFRKRRKPRLESENSPKNWATLGAVFGAAIGILLLLIMIPLFSAVVLAGSVESQVVEES